MIDVRTWLLQMRAKHWFLITEKHMNRWVSQRCFIGFALSTAIIMSSNKQTQCFALINKQPGQMWLHFFQRPSFLLHLICAFEWIARLHEETLEDGGCMRVWGPEKEELCRDGVRCVEIKQERREQAGSASDNSRKDNKGEGVSCECSLRKSLLHLLL